MANFTMRVRVEKDGHEWDEEYNKPEARDQKSAERCAQSIIEYFNSTLRPFELARSVVSVTFGSGNASQSHVWEKSNLVTIMGRRGSSHDTARCSRCGITGKRFGLGNDVVRDPKFKAKGYGSCDTAKELLAKRTATVTTAPVGEPTPRFALPLRYLKGQDNEGQTEGVAGTIRNPPLGGGGGYHVMRVWGDWDKESVVDEFAEFVCLAVNAYPALQARVDALEECCKKALTCASLNSDVRALIVSALVLVDRKETK